jgi:hypothetical protein
MSAEIIRFSAARVALLLGRSNEGGSAEAFIDHMAQDARSRQDSDREEFWREVAHLVARRAG